METVKAARLLFTYTLTFRRTSCTHAKRAHTQLHTLTSNQSHGHAFVQANTHYHLTDRASSHYANSCAQLPPPSLSFYLSPTSTYRTGLPHLLPPSLSCYLTPTSTYRTRLPQLPTPSLFFDLSPISTYCTRLPQLPPPSLSFCLSPTSTYRTRRPYRFATYAPSPFSLVHFTTAAPSLLLRYNDPIPVSYPSNYPTSHVCLPHSYPFLNSFPI